MGKQNDDDEFFNDIASIKSLSQAAGDESLPPAVRDAAAQSAQEIADRQSGK
ncbi:hypothetical protein [Streptomyces sp. NRRL F-4489]|uniref:hypothetical protein n=1 Tax=Streptomyces sp. NRRL F-4489 TaxID=1609095 RepID=UPI00131D0E04|nr:hypothetical protein [Streptomyces sp. NRRL F-4489]